jgi:aspartate racemase
MQERKLIKRNSDYPQIIINSIPAPELIFDNISKNDLRPYDEGLKELDKFQVDFIVMVCNTIHLYHKKLQKGIKTPILDLRKELQNHLIKNKIKTVTVLGTPLTIKKGLYKFKGIKYQNPSAEEMKQLTETIFLFNKGVEKNKQIVTVKKICEKYLQKGAECVILGCTEFVVMLDNKKFPKIDTIDILINSTVDLLQNQFSIW